MNDSGRTEFQATLENRSRRSVRFERRPSQRFSRRPSFERAQAEAARLREFERSDKKKETLQRIDGGGGGSRSDSITHGEQVVLVVPSHTSISNSSNSTHVHTQQHAAATATAIVHGQRASPSPISHSSEHRLADGCGCAPAVEADADEEPVEHLYANANVTHTPAAAGTHANRAVPSSEPVGTSKSAIALLASSPTSPSGASVVASPLAAVRLNSGRYDLCKLILLLRQNFSLLY